MTAFTWLLVMCTILWVFVLSAKARRFFGKWFAVKNARKEDQETNDAVSWTMSLVSAMLLTVIVTAIAVAYLVERFHK